MISDREVARQSYSENPQMCVTHNPWNRRWVHTPSSIEDEFTGLRTVELKIVVLRPGLYVVKFGGSRWFIAGRYYKVSIIHLGLLTQKTFRGDSFEVSGVNNIGCGSDSWSLDYTGGDVFEFRCNLAVLQPLATNFYRGRRKGGQSSDRGGVAPWSPLRTATVWLKQTEVGRRFCTRIAQRTEYKVLRWTNED